MIAGVSWPKRFALINETKAFRFCEIACSGTVMDFAVDPSGRFAAMTWHDGRHTTRQLDLVELGTGARRSFEMPGRTNMGFTWSPSGRKLAVATEREGIVVIGV